mmetsp:Transcript_1086/g.2771  ORF Transcript_1086/g.2771 Transcript_1086/m.2771 type:complete len:570 (+) Transcript_1086:290-1999(+)
MRSSLRSMPISKSLPCRWPCKVPSIASASPCCAAHPAALRMDATAPSTASPCLLISSHFAVYSCSFASTCERTLASSARTWAADDSSPTALLILLTSFSSLSLFCRSEEMLCCALLSSALSSLFSSLILTVYCTFCLVLLCPERFLFSSSSSCIFLPCASACFLAASSCRFASSRARRCSEASSLARVSCSFSAFISAIQSFIWPCSADTSLPFASTCSSSAPTPAPLATASSFALSTSSTRLADASATLVSWCTLECIASHSLALAASASSAALTASLSPRFSSSYLSRSFFWSSISLFCSRQAWYVSSSLASISSFSPAASFRFLCALWSSKLTSNSSLSLPSESFFRSSSCRRRSAASPACTSATDRRLLDWSALSLADASSDSSLEMMACLLLSSPIMSSCSCWCVCSVPSLSSMSASCRLLVSARSPPTLSHSARAASRAALTSRSSPPVSRASLLALSSAASLLSSWPWVVLSTSDTMSSSFLVASYVVWLLSRPSLSSATSLRRSALSRASPEEVCSITASCSLFLATSSATCSSSLRMVFSRKAYSSLLSSYSSDTSLTLS